MEQIESKKHIVNYYLAILFQVVFYFLLGTFMIWIYYNDSREGTSKKSEILLVLFGVGVYFLAYRLISNYFKNGKKFIVDKTNFYFDGEKFLWSEIKDIRLTGKEDFYNIPFITNYQETTLLILKNGRAILLYDFIYSNMSELKSFIRNVIIEKKENWSIIQKNSFLKPIDENYETYLGNQFTSLRGISLWGMIIFFLYLFIFDDKKNTTNMIIVFSIFGIFWFAFNSYLMFYFKVSTTHLLIKNHNFLWVNKLYQLDEIEEIVYETRDKMPNSMRVITKDFKNELFRAGTLRDKTWLVMKKQLEKNKVVVRNECIWEDE